jgi:hypothetical protein
MTAEGQRNAKDPKVLAELAKFRPLYPPPVPPWVVGPSFPPSFHNAISNYFSIDPPATKQLPAMVAASFFVEE